MLQIASMETAHSKRAALLIVALCLLCLAGCTEQSPGSQQIIGDPIIVSPDSYRDLQELYDSIDYRLGNIDQGVPRLVLTRLPDDLENLDAITEKKRIFLLSFLPMVLMANEEIAYKRSRLKSIFSRHQKGSLLTPSDRQWLESLTREYRLSGDPLEQPNLKNRLLRRVDTIPPSLVLAQAANESGWGTSRFARVANNIFGEWTFIPGTGIVPENRPEGAEYEVRKFDTLYQSLTSYMRNLNTHRAYRPLRNIRAEMRDNGRDPDGASLARGLEKYSTRRTAYVEEIQQMIRQNNLTRLSSVYLKELKNVP